MNQFTKEDLEEALRAINSTMSKCEKAEIKLKEATSQHTLIVRRIKAFRIASSLIKDALENQNQEGQYINEYKRLILSTNLQKGYQEFVKFFRALRTYLEKELPGYTFTGNIVENNMDYSYFQLANDDMKSKGLKIVIAFVHGDFTYQVWLSGLNRDIQRKYYEEFTEKNHPYDLTGNPSKTDYILKTDLIDDCNYNDVADLMKTIKESVVEFIHNVERI